MVAVDPIEPTDVEVQRQRVEHFDRVERTLKLVGIYVTLVLAAGVLIAVLVAVLPKLNDQRDLSDELIRTQRIAVQISERNDCRAVLSSTFTEIDRTKRNLADSLEQQRAAVQLQALEGIGLSDEQRAFGQQTADALAIAVRAVDQIPRLTDVVDHGWTPSADVLATVPGLPAHLDPCPKVSR